MIPILIIYWIHYNEHVNIQTKFPINLNPLPFPALTILIYNALIKINYGFVHPLSVTNQMIDDAFKQHIRTKIYTDEPLYWHGICSVAGISFYAPRILLLSLATIRKRRRRYVGKQ